MVSDKVVTITGKRPAEPTDGVWDVVIDFDIFLRDINGEGQLEKVGEQRLVQVVDWISNTFKENFILKEIADNRIAGGWVDNKGAWNRRKRIVRSDYAWQSSYRLLCHEQDGNWFALAFQ